MSDHAHAQRATRKVKTSAAKAAKTWKECSDAENADRKRCLLEELRQLGVDEDNTLEEILRTGDAMEFMRLVRHTYIVQSAIKQYTQQWGRSAIIYQHQASGCMCALHHLATGTATRARTLHMLFTM